MSDPADDPIDEVRRIRAKISLDCEGDLDRLFTHLDEVGRNYAARRGVFACVTAQRAAEVEQSWGDLTQPAPDPLIDEIRAIRRTRATKSGG